MVSKDPKILKIMIYTVLDQYIFMFFELTKNSLINFTLLVASMLGIYAFLNKKVRNIIPNCFVCYSQHIERIRRPLIFKILPIKTKKYYCHNCTKKMLIVFYSKTRNSVVFMSTKAKRKTKNREGISI